MIRPLLLLPLLALPLLTLPLHAEGEAPSPVEAKLRESVRTTLQQLRTLEGERATLQAEKDIADAKVKELTAQVDKLTKQTAADQATSRKQIDDLATKSAAQEELIGKFKEALEKWKEGYAKAAAIAQQKENERSRLADANAILRRRVEDQYSKNVELAKIANEILDRYAKFGVGDALSAREPFTGIKRARLEALVQDYADKITDHRTKPQPIPNPSLANKDTQPTQKKKQ